ncbi:MAG: ribosome biogenesis GTPase Der [Pseudomonadota bacterium]
MMLPLVAIVGRPNVGKSTLFNRLIGRRKALVADQPGLTRDRHYGLAKYEQREFHVVDTGGLSLVGEGIEALVREQANFAIQEADLVLLVLDARDGLTSTDRDIAQLLRKTARPVLHVANKVDGPNQKATVLSEFYELGAKHVYGVSAEHNSGVEELIDAILEEISPNDPVPSPERTEGPFIRAALVGRPNAGKSALLNHLAGEQRTIVSEEPGTTRDPVDIQIQTKYGQFVMVDTAGIRRKRRSGPALENLAVLRALRAIDDADIVCLLIDAQSGVGIQDAKIAALTMEAGRGLVLVFTKSDLIGPLAPARKRIQEQIEDKLQFASFAPVLILSSITGHGTNRVFPTLSRIHRSCSRRIQTAELNRFLEHAVAAHHPSVHLGRPIRFYYITQPETYPPTFVVSTNKEKGVQVSYRRYLANRLREKFGFEGAPIRLFFREHKQRE